MTTTPVAPTWIPRIYRYATDQPRNHCSPGQVLAMLQGTDLTAFMDPDGSLTTLTANILNIWIPAVSARVVQEMRTPYDWCLMRYFKNGHGLPKLVLPVRNIAWVLVCFIRVLPSLPWYKFTRFRNADGTEFIRAGYADPPPTQPFSAPYNLSSGGQTPPVYTGIEDADLLVDTRARTLVIPPRALISPAGLPLASFNMVPGQLNIEVHFLFGYPPTKYASGQPIEYSNSTGAAIDPNPNPPVLNVIDPIDWSSGMPVGLTQAVAQLVANAVLRQKWRGASDGLSSLSVDGASESYGGDAYGGSLSAEEKSIMSTTVAQYGIRFI